MDKNERAHMDYNRENGDHIYSMYWFVKKDKE